MLFAGIYADDRPTVQTPLGTIVGSYEKSYEGNTYASYLGIPFAKPPVGNLRFAVSTEAQYCIKLYRNKIIQFLKFYIGSTTR